MARLDDLVGGLLLVPLVPTVHPDSLDDWLMTLSISSLLVIVGLR